MKNKGRTILIIILSLIVVIAGAAALMMNSKDRTVSHTTTEETDAEKVVVKEDRESGDILAKDKYPEVNTLVANYRKALTSGDIDALKEIYNTDEDLSKDVISSTSQIIESYNDTACYTKKGLEDGSYFCFIYDHLKISGIDTPAPNLTLVYIKRSAEGKYYIYRGEQNAQTKVFSFDADTQAYIDSLYQDDEVKDLMARVYAEKKEACEKDEALKNFIEGLSDPNNAAESESESEDDDEDGSYEDYTDDGSYTEDDVSDASYTEDYTDDGSGYDDGSYSDSIY